MSMPNYMTPEVNAEEKVYLGSPEAPFAGVYTEELKLTPAGVTALLDMLASTTGSTCKPLHRATEVGVGEIASSDKLRSGLVLQCIVTGTTADEEPDLTRVREGYTVIDGTVTWEVTKYATAKSVMDNYAPIDSPAFTGTPTAPTPALDDVSGKLATTEFVQTLLGGTDMSYYAPLESPVFTGTPKAPTAPEETADDQLATTAFVHALVDDIADNSLHDDDMAGYAKLDSPTFTGTPTAPTPDLEANEQQIATAAFVRNLLTGYATKTSAVLTGEPTAATPPTNANDTRLATTEFVHKLLTEYAPLDSPALIGTVTAPTLEAAADNDQVATTAFVHGLVNANGGIASSSLGVNGYVKFINGFIVQWGYVQDGIAPYENQQVMFPISFETACYGVWRMHTGKHDDVDTNDSQWQVNSVTTMSFCLSSICTASSSDYIGNYWIAIGV